MKTTMKLLCIAAASVLWFGCSDSTGSSTGHIEAFVVDNGQGAAPAAASPNAAPANESGANALSGSATGTAQVSISVDGSTWVDLSGPKVITVQLQSGQGMSIGGQVDVPVGTYAHVRVMLQHVQASLAAGSVVGGVTLTTSSTVMVGGTDHTCVVEKTVSPFQVRAGASTQVRFDLNSAAWINSQTVQAQSAADATVQAAVAAMVVTS